MNSRGYPFAWDLLEDYAADVETIKGLSDQWKTEFKFGDEEGGIVSLIPILNGRIPSFGERGRFPRVVRTDYYIYRTTGELNLRNAFVICNLCVFDDVH